MTYTSNNHAEKVLERHKRLGEGWQSSFDDILEDASDAPGYTTYELSLVCAAAQLLALRRDVAHVLHYGHLGKQSKARLKKALA